MSFETIGGMICLGLLGFLFVGSIGAMAVSMRANISGWTRLAQHYTYSESFRGTKWYIQSGYMGHARYRSCLTIGIDQQGLYLEVFPFGMGHSPLYIPWQDLTVTTYPKWPGGFLDLTAKHVPAIPLRFEGHVGIEILELYSTQT